MINVNCQVSPGCTIPSREIVKNLSAVELNKLGASHS